jgi:hypothetical protein
VGHGICSNRFVVFRAHAGPAKERLIEGYYNFKIAEKFSLSFHMQHFWELRPGVSDMGYLVPGVRLQASF